MFATKENCQTTYLNFCSISTPDNTVAMTTDAALAIPAVIPGVSPSSRSQSSPSHPHGGFPEGNWNQFDISLLESYTSRCHVEKLVSTSEFRISTTLSKYTSMFIATEVYIEIGCYKSSDKILLMYQTTKYCWCYNILGTASLPLQSHYNFCRISITVSLPYQYH